MKLSQEEKRKHKDRIKLTPYRTLYKKARCVFAAWIRNRDKTCICCGNKTEHAGHYIHRNCFDFSEELNNGCCARCNVYLHGNLGVYTLKMIEKYGHDQVELWHTQGHEIVRFSREFLENVIRKYNLNGGNQK